jgi:Rod binding domain-containing protein
MIMDPVMLPLTNQPAPPVSVGESSRTNEILLERRKIESAKGFESLLISKLVDSMKETVGESGLLEDEGSEQLQSMFWMHLSSALSEQGGVGLWKDIYKSIYGTAPKEQSAATLPPEQLDRTI